MEETLFIRRMTACRNALNAFIFTLLPKPEQAEEVLQNTHIEMWVKRDAFTEGNFLAWACRIAHFKVLEYRSALARDRLIFDDELIDVISADAEQYQAGGDERSHALEDCLDVLPSAQRDLLHKRYAGGYSVLELASQVKRPAGSLRVTLFRIRKALLDCIQRKLAAG